MFALKCEMYKMLEQDFSLKPTILTQLQVIIFQRHTVMWLTAYCIMVRSSCRLLQVSCSLTFLPNIHCAHSTIITRVWKWGNRSARRITKFCCFNTFRQTTGICSLFCTWVLTIGYSYSCSKNKARNVHNNKSLYFHRVQALDNFVASYEF